MGRALLVAVVGISAAVGCSSEADVEWADYSPALQVRIDRMAKRGDCEGLQAEFDQADANNDATMSRTGHNNAELMDYIDAKLTDADCY